MPLFNFTYADPNLGNRSFRAGASYIEIARQMIRDQFAINEALLENKMVLTRVGGLLIEPMGGRTIEIKDIWLTEEEYNDGKAYAKATEEFEKEGFEVLGTFDDSDSAMNAFQEGKFKEMAVEC